MIQTVFTPDAPPAIGPYSQGKVIGEFVFLSGQIPLDPVTGLCVGDSIQLQAEQVMKNIHAVLTAAGSDFEHVIKTTCFLSDMLDFNVFNEIYASYFTSAPARSCVAVSQLPKNVLCEVEVIAQVIQK